MTAAFAGHAGGTGDDTGMIKGSSVVRNVTVAFAGDTGDTGDYLGTRLTVGTILVLTIIRPTVP